jgi:DNA-binding NarL/FixJ family response regulator
VSAVIALPIRRHAPGPLPVPLSQQLSKVAALAWAGESNKEIAWRLGLKESTVKMYMSRIADQVRVWGRAGVALYWERHGTFFPVVPRQNGPITP